MNNTTFHSIGSIEGPGPYYILQNLLADIESQLIDDDLLHTQSLSTAAYSGRCEECDFDLVTMYTSSLY